MIVATRGSDDITVLCFDPPGDVISLLRRGLRREWIARGLRRYQNARPSGYDLFSDDRSVYQSTLLDQIPGCDVVNLHWVAGFLDYKTFFARWPQSKPVVWTLHDMNAFTGGCHYDMGCGKYVNHCKACPQLGSAVERDLSYQILGRKQAIFSQVESSRLHIVTPSRWLGREVKRSSVLQRFPLSVIPYGVDVEHFAPRDQRRVRGLVGIPLDAKVVLFVADALDNQRKGFACLVDALARCAAQVPRLLLVSLGGQNPNLRRELPCMHLGSLNNDRFLSMVYSAADVFVTSSVQDNLPNTVLEAMACGTPVVCFGVGGNPDMVRDEVNGLVVAHADMDALADSLKALINDGEKCKRMSSSARRIALEEYSLELQARRYAELYASLV